MTKRIELSLFILILLTAAALRLWRLDSVPPGFTHDEASHGHDAVAILRGARPIYQTVGSYGREPLYDYLTAGLMGLLGPTGRTLRFSVVPLGLTTLLLSFAWVRLAFDGLTALAALALQAVSFWSLSTSRQALRSGLLPVLFTAAVLFYWYLVESPDQPRRRQIGLFAFLIGTTLYVYIPARVLWTVFPAFLAYLALFQRAIFRSVWLPTLAGVLVGLLLAAPLFAYLRAHPEAEQRLGMLDAPLQALSEENVSVVLNQAKSAAAGFLLPGRGDDFLAYTIPGRPVFDLMTGVLFLVGLGVCLARWREPAYAFSLIWFAVGISPSLITSATASSTRSIAALPVVFLFPALAVVTGARWAKARWGDWVAWALGAGFVLLVAITGAVAAYDYFVTWGESADVRAAYQHTLVETAKFLDTQTQGGVVAMSTLHPHASHDPYVFEMGLRRSDLTLRWFDVRRALLLPPEPTARLIAPSSASLDPYFADLPGLRLRQRVTLRADDLDPFFVVYDWEPQVTLAALRERAGGAPSDPAPPVNLGDALQLQGYDLRTPAVAPGGTIELVTLWQVTDPQALRPQGLPDANAELVLFTHALNAAGAVVGQEDRLDAPAWDWQTGDVIAQIHRFPLQAELPPGPVMLEVGVYRRVDLTRLPILTDGIVVADRVLLQTVEVIDR
jgi:4-amino-4-deoxy-L-arabinose transferase-like glycosyltransferase